MWSEQFEDVQMMFSVTLQPDAVNEERSCETLHDRNFSGRLLNLRPTRPVCCSAKSFLILEKNSAHSSLGGSFQSQIPVSLAPSESLQNCFEEQVQLEAAKDFSCNYQMSRGPRHLQQPPLATASTTFGHLFGECVSRLK